MKREGALKPGISGQWGWQEDGEYIAKIGYKAAGGKVTLSYRYRAIGGDWEDVEQPVRLLWAPCGYGGERAYFRCPGVVNGVHCMRTVVKLYSGSKYFLCRHCHDLTYASQSETRADRQLRRANKRRMALGGDPGIDAWIRKPKGMWHRTYYRHKAEILTAERLAINEFKQMLAGELSRDEMEIHFG